MTAPGQAAVMVTLRLNLTEDDREFIVGAFVERRRAARDEGITYEFADFARDALIASAHH